MAEMTIEQKRAVAQASARLRIQQQSSTPNVGPPPESPQGIHNTLTALPETQGPTLDQMTNDPVRPGPDRYTQPATAGQRFVQGAKDPYVGTAQIMANVGNRPSSGRVNSRISLGEEAYQNSRAAAGDKGLDWWRLGGNVVGMAPLAAALPGAKVASGLLSAAGFGALEGGITGAVMPVTDTSKPYWEQKRNQTLIGTAAGAGGGAVFNRLGKIISPKVDPNVKQLMDEGVTPPPGAILGKTAARIEDASSSINPFVASGQKRAVKEFNVAAYNRALSPIGQQYKGEVGHDGVKAVGDKLSQAYDDLLPKLNWAPDSQFAQDLTDIDASSVTMVDAKRKQFYSVIEKYLKPHLAQGGPLDGETLKKLESQIGAQIRRFDRPNATIDDLDVADALKDTLTAIRDSVERANPAHAERLKAINNGWAVLVRLERAVGVGSEDGVFTPAQLMQAVRTSERDEAGGAGHFCYSSSYFFFVTR